MAFGSRQKQEAGRARRTAGDVPGQREAVAPAGQAAGPRPIERREPADLELRMSPLYGGIVLSVGLTFCVLAVLPRNTGGRNFRVFCGITGVGAMAGGILLLRRRPVVVRMTATELCLPGAVIPWSELQDVRRARSYRNFWIGVYLKNPRKDLDGVSRRAREMLMAQNAPLADADYVIRETDLPRSGLWFLEECRKRMAM
jgi:hypothetical protein